MEPNQNLNQPTQAPVQAPVQPSMEGQMEAVLNEQSAQVTPPAQPAMVVKKKSNLAIVLTILLFVLIIAGGAVFSIMTIMNKDNEIKSLNELVVALKDTNNNDVDAEDYIYLNEYGIKVEKPENWLDLIRKISFNNGYPQGAQYYEIRESSNAGDGVDIIQMNEKTCDESTVYDTCFELGDSAYGVKVLVGELGPEQESVMTDEFKSWVMNPENYSTI